MGCYVGAVPVHPVDGGEQMIKVGTVCIIVGSERYPHLNGALGTVTGPLVERVWHGEKLGLRYALQLASGELPSTYHEWWVRPSQLIPIAPPRITSKERTREPVSA